MKHRAGAIILALLVLALLGPGPRSALAEDGDAARAAVDPWIAVEDLLQQGDAAAARKLAASAEGPDTKRLLDYIEANQATSSGTSVLAAALQARATREAGDPAGALAALEQLETAPKSVSQVVVETERGLATAALGKADKARSATVRALDRALAIGWLRQAANCLARLVEAAAERGDNTALETHAEQQLLLARQRGDRASEAAAHSMIALAFARTRKLDESREANERALAIYEELGDKANIAVTSGHLGSLAMAHNDLRLAVRYHRRAVELHRAAGSDPLALRSLQSLASALEETAAFAEALARHHEALDLATKLNDEARCARTLERLGVVHQRLDDTKRAVTRFRQAREAYEGVGDARGEARVLFRIGRQLRKDGRLEDAEQSHKQALHLYKEQDDRRGHFEVLCEFGDIARAKKAYAAAVGHYEEAARLARRRKDVDDETFALGGIALIHEEQGDLDRALVQRRAILHARERGGSLLHVAIAHYKLGQVHAKKGAWPEAREAFREALTRLRWSGAEDLLVQMLAAIGGVELQDGSPEAALAHAEEGFEIMRRVGMGLGDEQGARARSAFASIFDVGIGASVMLKKLDSLSRFLEAGRAATLRDALGARELVRAARVPDALLEAEAAARAEESRAVDELRRAAKAGKRKRVRRAARDLEAARDALLEVKGRIRRAARARAAIAYPVPDDLATIRGHLKPEEALVTYHLTPELAYALVVEPAGARSVTLGPAGPVREYARVLLDLGRRGGARGLAGRTERRKAQRDPRAAAEALRKLLIDPLALGANVRRVLVSPSDLLGYVPFGLLLEDREIIYVPSGTTYGLLRAEGHKRGKQVLGVGNPVYGVRASKGSAAAGLMPLPATESEVKTVADAMLLGSDATETQLRTAIQRGDRLRALHLACHGLLDPERPQLSALAISSDAKTDGLLHATEILDMDVAADLVVLSACDTGKGRLYRAEGIVGLTRAFMHAGAPRIICSLWKVDDEATRALMVKFYELWNPSSGKGVDAVSALQAAQAHVRDTERQELDTAATTRAGRVVYRTVRPWAHPYYWAAWVLWGLGE